MLHQVLNGAVRSTEARAAALCCAAVPTPRARGLLDDRLPAVSRSRIAAVIAAAVAAAGAIAAASIAVVLARATARRALRSARFTLRVATFRLYRPCADCRKRIHTDARVCRHCGYRKPSRKRRSVLAA